MPSGVYKRLGVKSRTCKDCAQDFKDNHSLYTKRCPDCRAQRRRDRDRITRLNLRDPLLHVSKLGHMAKHRAKVKKLPYNLTTPYLHRLWKEQKGRCAISGRVLCLAIQEDQRVNANAPSIDRIVPSKGYIKNNVRFVTFQINMAMGEFGDSSLLSLAKDIVNFRG